MFDDVHYIICQRTGVFPTPFDPACYAYGSAHGHNLWSLKQNARTGITSSALSAVHKSIPSCKTFFRV